MRTSQSPQRVLIFRDHLMCPSETFIAGQAEQLRRYEPWYLCSRVFAPPPSPERTIVLNPGTRFNVAEVAFKLAGWAPGLRQLVAEARPSLLHAHFGPDALRVLPLAQSLRIPLFATYHGFDATASVEALARSSQSARRYARHRSRLITGADRFIAVSQFIAAKLIQQGFPEERIRQHYIGIDPQLFTPDPSLPREPVVLFTGRLVEKKGCEHLIRAMAQVQNVIADCELIVIGDGPLRPELERVASELLRNFRFLGIQKQVTVKSWMNRAQLFCVPSITAQSGDAEGFGMVFAEAQAMETPVVSYASGGVPEAVCHGVTGLLAPEGNHRMLAENIIQLLRDRQMRTKFALAGREHVLKQFDIRKQSAKLEEIYDEVLRHQAEPSSAYQSTSEVNTCA